MVKGDRGLRSLEEEEVVARRGRRFSLDTTKQNRNGDSVRDFS